MLLKHCGTQNNITYHLTHWFLPFKLFFDTDETVFPNPVANAEGGIATKRAASIFIFM